MKHLELAHFLNIHKMRQKYPAARQPKSMLHLPLHMAALSVSLCTLAIIAGRLWFAAYRPYGGLRWRRAPRAVQTAIAALITRNSAGRVSAGRLGGARRDGTARTRSRRAAAWGHWRLTRGPKHGLSAKRRPKWVVWEKGNSHVWV